MNISKISMTLAVSGVVLMGSTAAFADTIRLGFDGNTLAANDDGSTGLVSVGFELNFFGVLANQLYVNNNGNVTLDDSLSTFTPFDLNNTGRQIIAPFFADVDTRSAGELVTYGAGSVDGRTAFGVNWIDVGYFANQGDPNQLNDFQLVLIDRADTGSGNFDIEFNYGDILWETGNASSGSNGLNGNSARAGFSNGSNAPGTFFELEGSAINGAFLNGGANELISGSNIGVDGRFLFTARDGAIIQPPPRPPEPPNPVPLPAAGWLMMMGLGGLAVARRKRRS